MGGRELPTLSLHAKINDGLVKNVNKAFPNCKNPGPKEPIRRFTNLKKRFNVRHLTRIVTRAGG